ncbi:hypothetical protein E1B28_013194 [Marasmius oreades]|uniref:Uncharacterized protein n=1 Tax=Marasmius oreades TaxID=181124 RepID=A0A9P7UPM5_9AGAR|nr:uncharacterized protein E1B28_013194 [Marasmius oreades]KAG7087214.1 hypothetical protein E1B28_013194 [Marasmius oreades]
MSISVQESQEYQEHQQSNHMDSDARSSIFNFEDDEDEHDHAEHSSPSSSSFDKSTFAHLISSYGSSSSTAWLEFSRYDSVIVGVFGLVWHGLYQFGL